MASSSNPEKSMKPAEPQSTISSSTMAMYFDASQRTYQKLTKKTENFTDFILSNELMPSRGSHFIVKMMRWSYQWCCCGLIKCHVSIITLWNRIAISCKHFCQLDQIKISISWCLKKWLPLTSFAFSKISSEFSMIRLSEPSMYLLQR